MRTTNFDAIAAAAPLDRQASVVRDGSGDLYEAPKSATQAFWTAPPEPEGPLPPGVEDLSGRAFGQMRVIRYHKRNPKTGSLWLCRCVCGGYELRRGKIVRESGGKGDGGGCCHQCDRVRRMREGRFKSTRSDQVALLDRLAAGERP